MGVVDDRIRATIEKIMASAEADHPASDPESVLMMAQMRATLTAAGELIDRMIVDGLLQPGPFLVRGPDSN